MANRKVGQWLNMLACGLILLKTVDADVGITYVENAVAKGAVCLDGSPPAYNWDKGFGSGINNWLVHLQGGGWCQNVTSCLLRKNTDLGSSKQMQKQLFFPGILSNQQKLNPDFYNWNRIVVRYCDGASFTGDVEEVNPDTNLHFRGGRIFVAVIEELLAKGMKNAENAILTGCSSGGLATIFHCDGFRVLLPKGTEVKCVSDAGYFVNVKDITGVRYIEAYYNDLVTTHGSAKNLPKSCTTKLSPGLCFFPQNVAQLLETPLFILNAAYDSWQKKEFDVGHESRIAIVIILEMLRQLRCYVQSHCFFVSPCSLLLCHMDLGFGYKIPNVLVPRVADPYSLWSDCKLNTTSCSTDQLKIIEGFRLEFLHALEGPCRSSSRGLFINSCYVHCQSVTQETWLSNDSFVLGGKTIAGAVGDWYHNRCPCQKIDGSVSPFSETCHNSEETLYPI